MIKKKKKERNCIEGSKKKKTVENHPSLVPCACIHTHKVSLVAHYPRPPPPAPAPAPAVAQEEP